MNRNGSLSKAASAPKSNAAPYVEEIQDAMRDLLQKHLPEPALSEYGGLRYQWKNMKTVEPLAAKSPTGDIDPSLLNTQVSKSFKDRAYRPSELDQLAKVGVAYMKPGAAQHKVAEFAAHMLGGMLGHMTLGGMHGYFAGGAAGQMAMDRLLRAPPV